MVVVISKYQQPAKMQMQLARPISKGMLSNETGSPDDISQQMAHAIARPMMDTRNFITRSSLTLLTMICVIAQNSTHTRNVSTTSTRITARYM